MSFCRMITLPLSGTRFRCLCALRVGVFTWQETCWSGVCLKTWTWTEWSSKPSPAAPTESPQTSCECRRVHARRHAGGRRSCIKMDVCLNPTCLEIRTWFKTRKKLMTLLSFWFEGPSSMGQTWGGGSWWTELQPATRGRSFWTLCCL